jgi:hypothetical protein
MATQTNHKELPVRVAQSQHRPSESAAKLEGALWRKSSFSTAVECVAVSEAGSRIALRNSNRPDGGTLMFSRGTLAAWIAGVKAGEFDDLTACE